MKQLRIMDYKHIRRKQQSAIYSLKSKIYGAVLAISLLSALLYISCDDVYDNIKDFSVKEVVYPAHFDTIFARSGYERVEIDLVKQGRLPASLMYLGKAKKTVVEYDTVRLPYDSVCSWVNITGLTLPKLYRFKVYTVDEHGNRSIPMEVALTPYTSADREALEVPSPGILSLSGFVAVEWTGGLSSDILDYLSMSYSYKDRTGATRTGHTENSMFFVNNINANEEVTVDVTYRVIPKIGGKNILDSVSFSQQIEVIMSSEADPIEFTVTPSRMALLAGKSKIAVTNLPYGLSWTSSNPAVATVNANGVVTARSAGTAVITVRSDAIENAVATIAVTVPDVSSIPAGDRLTGIWTFDDAGDLVKAGLGADLKPYGNSFTPIAGPQNTGGVKIGAGSYYGIEHGIAASGGGKKVNEYTLMMDVRVPNSEYTAWKSVFNPQQENVAKGIVWSNNGEIGHASLGGYSHAPNVLQPDTWHRVVFAAQLGDNKRNDAFRLYIDGEYVWEALNTDSNLDNITLDGRLSLYPDALYIGYDDMGAGYPGPDFAGIRMWNVKLTDAQVRALGKP